MRPECGHGVRPSLSGGSGCGAALGERNDELGEVAEASDEASNEASDEATDGTAAASDSKASAASTRRDAGGRHAQKRTKSAWELTAAQALVGELAGPVHASLPTPDAQHSASGWLVPAGSAPIAAHDSWRRKGRRQRKRPPTSAGIVAAADAAVMAASSHARPAVAHADAHDSSGAARNQICADGGGLTASVMAKSPLTRPPAAGAAPALGQ